MPENKLEDEKLKAAVLEQKSKRRERLREHFQREISNPFQHASEEGGAVFDPALQRYYAMKENTFWYFRPNFKNFSTLCFCLVPMFTLGYFLKNSRDERERKYRRGEVAYKDRRFKFI